MGNWNPVSVSDEPGEAQFINGRWVRGVNWTLGDEDHDKLRKGFKCISCMEDWSGTDIGGFPDECPLCGFQVKEHQAYEYEYSFGGFKDIGSKINADEELERLARQKDERLRREGLKSKGIVIPRNVKL